MFYAIAYYFKKFSLPIYFFLAYAISWPAWIALANRSQGSTVLSLVGAFGPTLAGLIMIILTQGETGLKGLGKRLTTWKVSPVWYAVALLGGPALVGLSLAIHVGLGGDVPVLRDPAHVLTAASPWYLAVVVFLYILVFSVMGEEIGWRGYALPRLQTGRSAVSASVLLGVIWAFWHLPLFWIPGDVHHRLPLGWFLMQVIGSSILYAWMMNRTRGSLVLVSLFHAACNTAVGLLPILPLDAGGSLRPLWILLVLQWLVVGGIIAFSGSESQERNRPRLTSSANPAEG